MPKIWLNHGLKLTIFKGTGPRRNKKERICKIKGGRKKGVLQKMWKWQIHTFLKELLDQRSKYLLFFFKFSSANLMIMYRCSVIFVTNSCDESLDSSSWVAVHNQWVPVHQRSPKLKMLMGLYVTRQLIWRQKPKLYSLLKLRYSPSYI